MPETGFSCASCQHFLEANETGGLCRRYPPQLVVLPGKLMGQVAPTPLFPAVNKDAYCGEHQMAAIAVAVPVDSRLAREAEGEA